MGRGRALGSRRAAALAAIAMLLGGIACVLSLSEGRAFAAGDTARAAASRPSNAALARDLGRDLKQAATVKAKRKVLLRIANAVNIGVYKANGDRVSRGSERRQSDLVFYDFELGVMAQALKAKDGYESYEDMAREVSALVPKPKDWSLSPADLRSAVMSATRKAKNSPGKRLSLLPLVVREVGRKRSPDADTASKTPLGARVFDPVQSALIAADIWWAAARKASQKRSAATSAPPQKRAGDDGDCLGIGAIKGAQAAKTGAFLAGLTKALGEKLSPILAYATIATDTVHGVWLGLAVDFQPAKGGQVWTTHYGPADHDSEPMQTTLPGGSPVPGRKMVFQVGFQVVYNIPDAVVKCGALAGLKFPEKGPVEDIPIDWNPVVDQVAGGYRQLKKHGTIVREDRKTNKNGLAVLVFKPRDEVLVGIGKEEVAKNRLAPKAEYLGALGSTLGIPADLLGLKNTYLPWAISFHSQRGTVVLDSKLTLPPEAYGLACQGLPDCSTSGHIVLHVLSNVPVEYDASSGGPQPLPSGTAPLTWVDATGQVSYSFTCSTDPHKVQTDTFTPMSTKDGDLVVPSVSGGIFTSGPQLDLALRPVYPTERYRFAATGCQNETQTRDLAMWYVTLYYAHQAEVDSNGVYRVSGFTRSGAGLVRHYKRSRTVTATGAPFTLQEDTLVGLFPNQS